MNDVTKSHEIYTLGIVLLGDFNPVIITPYWLSSKSIIRETEADTAKVEIIHSDITRFETDWLIVEASKNRIDFTTKRESHFSALKDLVVSVFTLLKETPIKAIGINHLCHYSFRDIIEYENFGYWLSPAKELAEILNKPKLNLIQFIETTGEKKEDGRIQLAIAPSDLVLDSKSVVFNANHHFNNLKGTSAKSILELLNSKWDFSFKKVNELNQLIWKIAKY